MQLCRAPSAPPKSAPNVRLVEAIDHRREVLRTDKRPNAKYLTNSIQQDEEKLARLVKLLECYPQARADNEQLDRGDADESRETPPTTDH